MLYLELEKPVRHSKEAEGGRDQVSKAMEQYGKIIAIKEKEESALKMVARRKLTLEEIADYLDLPLK